MTERGTTTEQRTVVPTLGRIAADVDGRRALPVAHRRGVHCRPARDAVVVRDQAAVRLAGAGAAHQGAGRLAVARLRGYGAVPEEVPTISVEPPRNPQQMDKAVRGLVEGRYEWIAFTSVNAVKAVREKFEEYGLDARAFSGLKIAAVGGRPPQALRAWGLARRPGARPASSPPPACSRTGRRTTTMLDPINRVFLPRADIATETLVAGLQRPGLGGRRRHGLPHRAGRAAAGADPRRDQDRRVRRGASSPRPRRCATWSASPASRTRRRSSP